MDLSIVSTDDLVEELFNRCDEGAIVLYFNKVKASQDKYARYYHGHPFFIAGLLFDGASAALNYAHSNERADYLDSDADFEDDSDEDLE